MITKQHRGSRRLDDSYGDRPGQSPGRLLLTVEQAADRLNVGRSTTYRLVLSGELESVTVGRLRRVPAEAVADFVDSLRRA
jgi:excisionase family DNA binding protein